MPRISSGYKAYRESERFNQDAAAGKLAGQGGVPRGITTITTDPSYQARRVNKKKDQPGFDVPIILGRSLVNILAGFLSPPAANCPL